MKKHIMKTTALCAAAVIAVAGSSMTANAAGPFYTDGDGWFSGEKQDNAEYEEAYMQAHPDEVETITFTWDVGDSAPADDSASVSESSASNDNASYDIGSNDVSNDSGSNKASSDNSSSDSGTSYTDSSSTNAGTSSGPASSATTSASTDSVKRSEGKVTIPGSETFCEACDPAKGTYTLTHMGQVKYAFQLKDEDGNNVPYEGISYHKSNIGGKFFIYIAVPADKYNEMYTVVTTKGDASYLAKLGLSGVSLHGTVLVDVTEDTK